MKKIIQYSVIVLFVGIGVYVGNLINKYILPNIGANFITPADIIGCYLLSILLIGGIGLYISAFYLEDKL